MPILILIYTYVYLRTKLILERIKICWFPLLAFQDCSIRVICVYLLQLENLVTALLEYIDLLHMK